jgi:hypothetical protein
LWVWGKLELYSKSLSQKKKERKKYDEMMIKSIGNEILDWSLPSPLAVWLYSSHFIFVFTLDL